MTQDNKIWHTHDESPKDFMDVVFVNSETGNCAVFFTPYRNGSFVYDKWAYVDDLVASSKALEKLDAEYNEFICNTWVDYADEPDEKLASDARMLRERIRKVMSSQILKERDNYKKALDVAIEALKELVDSHVQGPADAIKLWASVIAETATNKINEIIKGVDNA